MKYGNLILEKKEYVFLKRLLNVTSYYKDENTKVSLKKLSGELTSAIIYDHEEMPDDVIRFNSSVTVQSGTWQTEFQLVIPTERNIAANKISILAPMGSAVMGYAEGDSVIWNFPNGTKELKITSVKQTERPIDIDVLL
ncbi:GreA/GreB family elongation factor [Aequorivita sp. F47161]|jgi:regulator of nucleoside diphosphate kinase|uniref:GreA/GreB family elongation factor n=1 Tax=Aequorivita vitellina TaxID=2874475 RepID=A0A9X1QSJ2_9FLAO|nr:GreA/GreB family elongation factor [Aequorivita vitellina]MCG2417585.1 GreA/GreB family elongation factor [Aequorivita vitellina]MCZ4318154.1 GreA/GreB family elongation factor [Aequorivita viscosa]